MSDTSCGFPRTARVRSICAVEVGANASDGWRRKREYLFVMGRWVGWVGWDSDDISVVVEGRRSYLGSRGLRAVALKRHLEVLRRGWARGRSRTRRLQGRWAS